MWIALFTYRWTVIYMAVPQSTSTVVSPEWTRLLKVRLKSENKLLDSLWPNDIICDIDLGQRLLTWQHQAVTWPNVDLSVRLIDIHRRAISQGMPWSSITKFSFKITLQIFQSNLPWANELSSFQLTFRFKKCFHNSSNTHGELSCITDNKDDQYKFILCMCLKNCQQDNNVHECLTSYSLYQACCSSR